MPKQTLQERTATFRSRDLQRLRLFFRPTKKINYYNPTTSEPPLPSDAYVNANNSATFFLKGEKFKPLSYFGLS